MSSPARTTSSPQFSKIPFATDFSPCSAAALQCGCTQAQNFAIWCPGQQHKPAQSSRSSRLGPAAHKIVEVAATNHPHVIVMGAAGETRLSVASDAVAKAHCPVLAVRDIQG